MDAKGKSSHFLEYLKIHFYTERKRLFLLLKSHWNKDVSGVNIPLRRLAFCCCGKRVCHSSLIIMEHFSLVPNNLEFCAGAQIWAYWYAGIWIAQLSACFMFFFSYQLFSFSVYESNLMRLNCVLFKKDAVKQNIRIRNDYFCISDAQTKRLVAKVVEIVILKHGM